MHLNNEASYIGGGKGGYTGGRRREGHSEFSENQS